MSVNEIGSSNLLSSVLAAAYASPSQGGDNMDFAASSTEDITISAAAKLQGAISGMSETDQDEMETFRLELTAAVEDGTFDAESLAEEAPEALVSFAEENGLELTEMLEEMAEGIESASNATYAPPPPPPMDAGSGGIDLSSLEELSEEEQSELQAFMEEMRESLEDGTFDSETLASGAPEALSALAEENDMELTELIEGLADEAQNGPPPPPPPMMAGAGEEEDEETDLLAQFLSTDADEETTS